jgi:hypothetical protein
MGGKIVAGTNIERIIDGKKDSEDMKKQGRTERKDGQKVDVTENGKIDKGMKVK